MKIFLKSFTTGVIAAIVAVYLYGVYYWFRDQPIPVDVMAYLLATYTIWCTVLAYAKLYRDQMKENPCITADATYYNAQIAKRKFDSVANKYIKEMYEWHIKPNWKRGKTSTSFTPSELSSEIDDMYFYDLPDGLIKGKLEKLGYAVIIETPTDDELQETYGDRFPSMVREQPVEFQTYLCIHSKWKISWLHQALKKE